MDTFPHAGTIAISRNNIIILRPTAYHALNAIAEWSIVHAEIKVLKMCVCVCLSLWDYALSDHSQTDCLNLAAVLTDL